VTELIDELDKNILSLIQDNARASFAEIAKKLGVSEGTIHIRVKKLSEKKVIQGFYTIISPEKLDKGLMAFVAMKANAPEYSQIVSKLINMSDIYEIHEVTGDFYSILKVRTKDKDTLADILDKIGAIKGVLSTHTMIVLKTDKERVITIK
jgi:Lrp/AsnC family transcriptional regulator for asnA, asnC and gidA